MRNADIVIVSAGTAIKPNEKREDALNANMEIIKGVAGDIKKYAPDSFVIIITNPLDVMTYLAKKVTGFPRNKIVGMAGILDSARFRSFVAAELGVYSNDVNTIVLGGHNDSMVPIVSRTTVNKKPVAELLPESKIKDIIEKTRHTWEDITNLLGTSAFFAPATGAANIAESFLKDEKRLFPCSVYLEGEYNQKDICLGVPVRIGKNGVEEIVELELTAEEKAEFRKSAGIIREMVEKVR